MQEILPTTPVQNTMYTQNVILKYLALICDQSRNISCIQDDCSIRHLVICSRMILSKFRSHNDLFFAFLYECRFFCKWSYSIHQSDNTSDMGIANIASSRHLATQRVSTAKFRRRMIKLKIVEYPSIYNEYQNPGRVASAILNLENNLVPGRLSGSIENLVMGTSYR